MRVFVHLYLVILYLVTGVQWTDAFHPFSAGKLCLVTLDVLHSQKFSKLNVYRPLRDLQSREETGPTVALKISNPFFQGSAVLGPQASLAVNKSFTKTSTQRASNISG